MLNQLLTTNGNTEVENWHGRDGTVFATGSFGGGAVNLQASLDGVVWFDCTDATGSVVSLSTNGAFSFSIGSCKLRLNLTGATVTGSPKVVQLAAVGSATLEGTLNVLFYSDRLTTPISVIVPVQVGDTAATWANRVRAYLQEDARIAELFVISVVGTSIRVGQIGPVFTPDASLEFSVLAMGPIGVTGGNSTVFTAGATSSVALNVRIAER